jgi:hypothetical protein
VLFGAVPGGQKSAGMGDALARLEEQAERLAACLRTLRGKG